MKKTFRLLSLFLAVILVLSLSACANQNSNSSSSAEKTVGDSSEQAQDSSPAMPEVIDPMGKYEPAIKITSAYQDESSKDVIIFPEGDSYQNNVTTRSYKEELGIELEYLFSVPPDQYTTKINTSIASGEVPDVFMVNPTQLKMLVNADAIAPLDEVFEKYGSEYTKKYLPQDDIDWMSVHVNGKLMALPRTNNPWMNIQQMWIRTDWLNKLGLEKPKTIQEAIAVAEAFAKHDPDGNSKDDTVGLAFNKGFISSDQNSLKGFFNSYNTYPDMWINDSSGKLVFGGIQPQVKNVLVELQKMYGNGILDKEFVVKDENKVNEMISAGKVGLFFGIWWEGYLFGTIKKNIPESEIEPLLLPSAEAGKPGIAQITSAGCQSYVVSKKCKNPEALIKLMNWTWKHGSYVGNSKEEVEKYNGTGKPGAPQLWKQNMFQAWPADWMIRWQKETQKAYKSKDPSSLPLDYADVYNNVNKWIIDKNPDYYANYLCHYLGFNNIVEAYDNKLFLYDGYLAAPTDTMGEKMATLQKMQEEVYTAIIMGESPDNFDKFIEDWKKLGGDKITQEVQDWQTKNSK